MLLDRYDFYDIQAVLIAIRYNPLADYNVEIIDTIKNILEKSRKQFLMNLI